VFGGAHHEIYLALLKARRRRDGLRTDDEVLAMQFRLHLHRGIGYRFGDRQIQRVGDLFKPQFKRLPLPAGATP
jgi:DNA sulfur modification protein DndE